MAVVQKCQLCGANVHPEHVDEGRAGRWAGQLLCAVCYAEKRVAAAPPKPGGVEAAPEPAAGGPPPLPPAHPAQAMSVEEEPISLVDASSGEAGSKIQAFASSRIQHHREQFNRKTTVTGRGATRVRTFHSKIQAESIEFMDSAINDWLDDNPDVEVKFATSTIGTMAGKFPEPNLILNIWY